MMNFVVCVRFFVVVAHLLSFHFCLLFRFVVCYRTTLLNMRRISLFPCKKGRACVYAPSHGMHRNVLNWYNEMPSSEKYMILG